MERFQKKQMNTEEQGQFVQSATLKYHCPPGTRLKAYHDGWTQLGRDYYHSLLKRVKEINGNKELWEVMKENWRTYLNINKRGSFVHVAANMGGHNVAEMEEEEASDEEDMNQTHTIDLPDDDDNED